MVRKAVATPMTSQRTTADSLRTGRGRAGWRAEMVESATDIGLLPSRAAGRPALQAVDQEQDDEGGDEHDHRDRGGVRGLELLQLDDDEQRRDLRHVGQITGNEDHRSIFADAAREGEREA